MLGGGYAIQNVTKRGRQGMSQGKTPGLLALSLGKLPCCAPAIVVTLKLFKNYPREVTMGPELQE